MLFIDEETRDDFHKAETLVQVVCQMLENEVFNFNSQIRVIGVAEGDALVQVTSGPTDILVPICSAVNQRFKRLDGSPVCSIKDLRLRYILVHVTHPSELAELL